MQYSAFISYSHADEKEARWLMRKLESFRVPKNLVGTAGEYGKIPTRIGRVFRDRDELASSGNLGQTVNKALQNSNALIVICSRHSAQSKWVNAEIAAFRSLGREARIYSFIISGDPQSKLAGSGCFPASLLEPDTPGEPEREPLAADARTQGDGKEKAFLKLTAGLLGVGYDALAQRHAQRKFRRLLALTTGSLVGMSVAIILAISAYIARNDAQRRQAQAEDIVGFMLGDLRQRLDKVGRLDLMRSVDDKAIQYFASLNARDLSDRTLEQQARSLTGIGEVRLNEGNYQEAMSAFKEAFVRTSALYQRAPKNAQRLFDLSQAEYWRGYVAWEQGRLDDAQLWLGRYRDNAIKLAKLDPNNFAWQREIAYGYHNLAVLGKSRGNYHKAETQMLAERRLYDQWLSQFPDDLELRFEAANVDSWLGSLALEQGKLAQAVHYFEKQVSAIEQNLLAEPDNVYWQEIRVESLKLLASANEGIGQLDAAKALYQQALTLAEQLHLQDPMNAVWLLELGNTHWRLVRYQSEDDDSHLHQANKLISEAFQLNPKDERGGYFLADVKIHLGRQALQHANVKSAEVFSKEVSELLALFWTDEVSESLRISYARMLIFKGEIYQIKQQPSLAKQEWQQAFNLLAKINSGNLVPFSRLPELLKVTQLLGKTELVENYQQQLMTAKKTSFSAATVD